MKDTWVWSTLSSNNFGHVPQVTVGRQTGKLGAATVHRSLLSFDVSALPADAIISGATLRLFVAQTDGPDPLNLGITIWRLAADFVEGDGSSGVTWNTQPGVEASPTAAATMSTPVGDWFEVGVTSLAIAERQSADPNNVLLRVAPTNETTVEVRWFAFLTKEDGTGTDRAQLVIDYEVPTPTPTATPTPLPPAPTPTPTPTETPTDTPTSTPTFTPTETPTETPDSGLPPDPSTVAPPIDRSVATSVFAATEFLYSGASPIQTDVAPGTIELHRAALLRGLVKKVDGSVLSGVQISVLNHPEYGGTLSRADGMFDLVVNGGGPLTLNYFKQGYAPIQRQLDVPWQDAVFAPDVVMLQYDSEANPIDLTAPTGIQEARGSFVSDDDGQRTATLLFQPTTQAELLMPDGDTQPITGLTVRLTEYTVGDAGPQAMPAELPPTTAYTYAIELSTDEAIAAGAVEVLFSEPVIFYVENFLGFSTGTIVPTGYYDRIGGVWRASDNGQVIEIMSEDPFNRAEVDTDGDQQIDNGIALGITDEERERLADLYQPDQTLWRVPLTHFSPFDLNWPEDTPTPTATVTETERTRTPTPTPEEDEPDCETGSIIECQNQTLRESVRVTGTEFSLNYSSRRLPGRAVSRQVEIPLTGEIVPGDLESITVEVLVAGQRTVVPFDASELSPNQSYTFEWDGRDAYGRLVQGAQPVTARIRHRFAANVYFSGPVTAPAFGRPGEQPLNVSTRQLRPIVTTWRGSLMAWDAAAAYRLGGWSLDVHHAYDPQARILYMGDGSQRGASLLGAVIETVAGNGGLGETGDGGPATDATLVAPSGLAIGPDGGFYIGARVNLAQPTPIGNRVRQVRPDGVIVPAVGQGCFGDSFCGTPLSVCLRSPERLDLLSDVLLIADRLSHRIRYSTGATCPLAGDGSSGYAGDGGFALDAKLRQPAGVAVALDGSIYIADTQNHVIRHVGTDSIITTVAGTGIAGYSGDGGLGSSAQLNRPSSLTVDRNGVVYIADTENHVVRRLDLSGRIVTVAGMGSAGYSGDGGSGLAAQLRLPEDVEVGRNGSIYIADTGNHAVRRVSPEGVITTYVGTGVPGFDGDGGPARSAHLSSPRAIAEGPDGSLYIADTENRRVRRVRPVFPGITPDEVVLPSGSGHELYVFDFNGRHLHTRALPSGVVLYEFGYDGEGRLSQVTDRDGNVTTIERDVAGIPTAIVGPFGQATALTLNPDGHLVTITSPADEEVEFTYSAQGLLTAMTDARDNTWMFQYDSAGRLTRDDDPAGGFKNLDRTQNEEGYEVTVGSAEGRTTTYGVERLSGSTSRRTVERPDGTMQTSDSGTNFGTEITRPDGAIVDVLRGPDPRFGMAAPVVGSGTISTPGGRVFTLIRERSLTLIDPSDLLSLDSQTDTRRINGRSFVTVFDAGSPATLTRTSAEMRQTVATLNSRGRVLKTEVVGTSPALYLLRREYDAQGRLTAIKHGPDPDTADTRTTTFAYKQTADDQNGLLETVTDALGREVEFSYDDAARVLTQIFLPGTPDQRSIFYTYDPNGNLTSLTTTGGQQHYFDYTEVNLEKEYVPPPLSVVDPKTSYLYNLDGQLTDIVRPDGKRVVFGYEPTGGRLQSVTQPALPAPGDEVRSYSYHPSMGKLVSLTAPDGVLSFDYDGSLPTSEQCNDGSVASTVTRTYDNDFRLNSLQVNSEAPITFAYDGDGLLTAAGALAPITRHPDYGFIVDTILGVVADSWDYSAHGELETYQVTVGASMEYAVQYTRDKLGRVKMRTEAIGGTTTDYEYAYDSAGRLNQVQKDGDPVAEYVHDVNGNRVGGFTQSGVTLLGATYDDQDRLLEYVTSPGVSTTYTYTDNGELYSKTEGTSITTYEYDALGNLRTVIVPGTTTIEYLIDGRNRRIGMKQNGSIVKRWIYKDQLNPVAELDGSGNIVAQFVYGTKSNIPDYMIRYTPSPQTHRIISDHLGSPKLVIDVMTGDIVQQMDYDEFGNTLIDTNPGFHPFGFAGGLYDPTTGLLRFGARDFEPRTGRWMSKDPTRFEAGDTNLYAYVLNDPVNFIDPPGTSQEDIDAAVDVVLEYLGQDQFPKNVGANPSLIDNWGEYRYFGDDLRLNPVFLQQNLSHNMLRDLLNTVIHEVFHSHDPALKQLWDTMMQRVGIGHPDIDEAAELLTDQLWAEFMDRLTRRRCSVR